MIKIFDLKKLMDMNISIKFRSKFFIWVNSVKIKSIKKIKFYLCFWWKFIIKYKLLRYFLKIEYYIYFKFMVKNND